MLFNCSGTAVSSLKCSKTSRSSRKWEVLSERSLRCWRIYFAKKMRKQAQQGTSCRSNRGTKARLSWEVHSNSAADSGYKWQWRKLALDVRRQLFTGSKVKHGDRLLRGGPSSTEVLKTHLDKALKQTTLTWQLALPWERVWTRWSPKVPLNLHFCFYSLVCGVICSKYLVYHLLLLKNNSVLSSVELCGNFTGIKSSSKSLAIYFFNSLDMGTYCVY